MPTINELIAKVKENLKATITTESSADYIKKVDGFVSELDGIEQEANHIIKEKSDITDMYIKAVKNQGSTEQPKDEEDAKPKSLEDIATEVINKDKK